MRLDWFLPALRRQSPDEDLHHSWLSASLRRLLPSAWFSNRLTKQRGLARRWLRQLGLSWLYSPVRRVCQALCFVTFLWLFFCVCWPYTASPAQSWPSWHPGDTDALAGRIELQGSVPSHSAFRPGRQLFATEDQAAPPDALIGRFEISEIREGQVVLRPASDFDPSQLETLSFRVGTWTLHESSPDWPSHYADDLANKEWIHAESLLVIDPLVSLSTAIAARSWVWSLTCAAIILVVCVLIPRGFCGYICPLGTLIDLFDWSIGKRVTRFRVPMDGWWVHVKYYLLFATLIAASCGVLISGYFAAIPVITRGLLFLGEPLQTRFLRAPHLVAPLHFSHFVSIGLFFAVLGLGFLRPRFWCKYVCPSGAVFSLGNLFRVSERKVESSCIHCNKCVEVCPFDAIKPDFTTRTSDCTLCQTCGGVCPTQAIKFVERWNHVELKVLNDPPTHETPIGRRGFLSLAAGSAAAVVGGAGAVGLTRIYGARLDDPNAILPIRPPGCVPEQQFLQLCIRCGECFKACPNNVLQTVGFEQGLEGLWTPQVAADWAGCESSCNACTQVCPTGAIRPLPLEEKRHARIGLAVVNEATCLPFAAREACQLCVDECLAAGYDAIEFTQVHTEVDEQGTPVDGSGFLAPVVLAEKCVGCGLCQTRCFGINADQKGLLDRSAIIVQAGAGREDRLMVGNTPFPINQETGFRGSYVQLRRDERARQSPLDRPQDSGGDSYLPDFLNIEDDDFMIEEE